MHYPTSSPPVLTEEERDDIRYIIQKATKGQACTMDLTDPREYRFYKRQLELGGITQELFPQTHQVVEQLARGEGRLATDQTQGAMVNPGSPVNVISQIASQDNGVNYITAAMSSIPGGTYDTTITIGLYDENLNLIGPLNSQKQSGNGTGFSVSTTGQFPTPIPPQGRMLYSIASIQYTTAGGSTLDNVVTDTFNFPKEINNIDPRDINKDNVIKVCLTRTAPDCDYAHNYNGTVEIPIQGNILYFGSIDVDNNGKPVNASNVIQIIRTDQGGNPLTPPSGFNFFNDPNTRVSGATLSWNLSWVSFGTANFNSGDQVYYVFSVVVQVGGQDVTAFITNAPSTVVPGQTALNTLKIPAMVVVYGCLSADSLISMADGTGKRVADVEAGDRVMSNAAGVALTVEDTVEGTEQEPMIRIMDEEGHSLLITAGHPVCTKNGIRLARQLEIGDEVLTSKGSSLITGLSEEMYPGIVYNLNVGLPGDGVDLTTDNTTFIASGIIVGDGRMQRYYGNLVRATREDVLQRIPVEWHQDYLNSLSLPD